MSSIGTTARGIRAGIIRRGDNLADVVIDSLENACAEGGFKLQERDIIAVTEAVLARSQGNVATFDQIAKDIKAKTNSKTVAVIHPIFSRNRFLYTLKGLAKGIERMVLVLPFPIDEVGNPLLDLTLFEEAGIDLNADYTLAEFRKIFKTIRHPWTGVDYLEEYSLGSNVEIIMSNNVTSALKYADVAVVASIHRRNNDAKKLLKAGAKKVLTLCDLMNESVDGSGYNKEFGLLGSNISTDNSLKLFPRDSKEFCVLLQSKIKEKFNVKMECMVYGDGAFKDAQHSIWELADPVVSPGYTDGLEGTPSELKFKFIADNKLSGMDKEKAEEEMRRLIRKKDESHNNDCAEGTTPRKLTDLLGSLADLTSGSGDKGTPFVLIQNYFTNYSK